ncbi:hypothetical protein RRG08_031042 [Elysia crispata]|uniref:Uncharacterized protein n=1 Tax=Elysia crispata TaxID=231223 RepID=A0AAE0ZF10_9GAST|nr:hypothetical protein RRG08_031042 [Elysia crispata]
MSMREKRNVTFQEPEIKHAFQEEPNNNIDSNSNSTKNTDGGGDGRKVASNGLHALTNGGSASNNSGCLDGRNSNDSSHLSTGDSTCTSGGSGTTKAENPRSGRSRSRARSRSWSRFRARRAKSQDVGGLSSGGGDGGGSVGRDLSGGGIKRERSLVSLVRTGSRNSVRSLVKLFETRTICTTSYAEVRRGIRRVRCRLSLIPFSDGWHV